MNTQELRLGNLVIADDEKTYKVSSISEYKITVDDEVLSGWWILDEIHSIPLTEEWLEKFGFKKMYDTESWNAYTIDCELGEDDNNFYIRRDEDVYYLGYDYDGSVDIFNDHEIKSVHQLQNLYFALTGEELTIKE